MFAAPVEIIIGKLHFATSLINGKFVISEEAILKLETIFFK